MKRMLLLTCLLGGALATAPSGAAPPKKPSGGSRPRAPRRPKVKRTTPELALQTVRRVDSGEVFPGNEITVRATVRSRSRTRANVAVLLTPTHPAGSPVQSRTISAVAGRPATVDIKVKVDRYAVKNESFTGTFMLVDPASTARNYISRRWKDAIQRDNTKRFTVPVNVPNYSVTATVQKVTVHNDCNPSKGSRWYASAALGSLATGYRPANDGDTPSRRRDYRSGPYNQPWPAPRGRLQVVNDRDVKPINMKLAIPRLSKNHSLVLTWNMNYNNGPAYDQEGRVGTVIGVIPPQLWRRGGTINLQRATPVHGSNMPHDNCGPNPFTLQVYIQAIPTDEVLN